MWTFNINTHETGTTYWVGFSPYCCRDQRRNHTHTQTSCRQRTDAFHFIGWLRQTRGEASVCAFEIHATFPSSSSLHGKLRGEGGGRGGHPLCPEGLVISRRRVWGGNQRHRGRQQYDTTPSETSHVRIMSQRHDPGVTNTTKTIRDRLCRPLLSISASWETQAHCMEISPWRFLQKKQQKKEERCPFYSPPSVFSCCRCVPLLFFPPTQCSPSGPLQTPVVNKLVERVGDSGGSKQQQQQTSQPRSNLHSCEAASLSALPAASIRPTDRLTAAQRRIIMS